jgi:malate dehydrogenase (oxaloacetate-decarboxylating)
MEFSKFQKEAIKKHEEWHGKIEVNARVRVGNAEELAIAYTPGVAAPCLAIQEDPDKSFELTRRSNLVLVVTDGSAVLGLGNIGPEAGMPVMEGKCALFKAYADVDAFPLCIASQDVDDIVRTVQLIAPSFGGINLEDIAAPRCFEVEEKLKESLSIPVFHDDQHGTAIVTLAALHNSLKLVSKAKEDVKIVISGAGAAGIAIAKLLIAAGYDPAKIILTNRSGALYEGKEGLDPHRAQIAALTNGNKFKGSLREALVGADVFIGVSAPGLLSKDDISRMNKDAIVFACANPTPEIMPDEAKAGGAKVVATGRSDFPNQINNVLVFPGVFRGALDCRAKAITDGIKLRAALAIADLIKPEDLSPENIIPHAFDKQVAEAVARAVKEEALREGLNQV